MHKFPEFKIIGVISDTHNLLRSEAIKTLQDSELIIHAGDIGEYRIIQELECIAPVVAVRGNVDRDEWCRSLPADEMILTGSIGIYVIHNLKELNADLLPDKTKVVISGHSHKPLVSIKDGVLYLNPGSAGTRRFKLPISVAKLHIAQSNVRAEIIELVA